MRKLLCSLALCLLAACASPTAMRGEVPPAAGGVARFALDGRFSVSTEAERYSGRLYWRHAAGHDELRIASPFGQVMAEIEARPGFARLVTSDRQVREAGDAQLLLREVIGQALPIDRLSVWVLARAGQGASVVRDAAGRVLRIDEDGWQIEYEYPDDGAAAPPSRLTAVMPGGGELRLRIEEWNFE